MASGMKKSCLVLFVFALAVMPISRAVEIECDNHSQCPDGQSCFFSYDESPQGHAGGICFDPKLSAPDAMPMLEDNFVSALETNEGTAVQDSDLGGLTVRSQAKKPATLKLGSGSSMFTMGLKADGDFAVSKDKSEFIVISRAGDMNTTTDALQAGSRSSKAAVTVAGQAQWREISVDDFFESSGRVGWLVAKPPADADNGKAPSAAARLDSTDLSTSSCGGLQMLGGSEKFNKPGGVKKRWNNLPKHSMVRIEATLHYIDRWNGESLSVMVGPQDGEGHSPAEKAARAANPNGGTPPPDSESARVVWQQTYSSGKDARPERNVCGDVKFGESKLSEPVNVAVPHEGEDLTVVFRSNFGQASTSSRSWGVSNVIISIL